MGEAKWLSTATTLDFTPPCNAKCGRHSPFERRIMVRLASPPPARKREGSESPDPRYSARRDPRRHRAHPPHQFPSKETGETIDERKDG